MRRMLLCCVKCTSVLDKKRIDDVEVDLCPGCGGLWLDHGETERLAKKSEATIERLRKLLAARKGPPPVESEVHMSCPACASEMNEVTVASVKLDMCTRCKGLFLDRGEVDAALAAVKEQKATVGQLIAAVAGEAAS